MCKDIILCGHTTSVTRLSVCATDISADHEPVMTCDDTCLTSSGVNKDHFNHNTPPPFATHSLSTCVHHNNFNC